MSHWYYNSSSGDLANEGGPIGTIVGLLNTNTPGLNWHELNVPGTATEAQAAAAAQKEFPKGAAPTGSAKTALGQAVTGETGGLLGLPTLSNLRDLVVRSVKVIVGALLIVVGVSSLLKNEGISVPKPPAVVPV